MIYALTALQFGCGLPAPGTASIRPRLTIARIKDAVARHYEISMFTLMSDRQDAMALIPRFVSIYLSRELTPKTMSVIAREHNRDHTSVINAIKSLEKRMLRDPDIAEDVEMLRARLAG